VHVSLTASRLRICSTWVRANNATIKNCRETYNTLFFSVPCVHHTRSSTLHDSLLSLCASYPIIHYPRFSPVRCVHHTRSSTLHYFLLFLVFIILNHPLCDSLLFLVCITSDHPLPTILSCSLCAYPIIHSPPLDLPKQSVYNTNRTKSHYSASRTFRYFSLLKPNNHQPATNKSVISSIKWVTICLQRLRSLGQTSIVIENACNVTAIIRNAVVTNYSAFFFNLCDKEIVVWLVYNIPVYASRHKYMFLFNYPSDTTSYMSTFLWRQVSALRSSRHQATTQEQRKQRLCVPLGWTFPPLHQKIHCKCT
jgi:hypothetical protein